MPIVFNREMITLAGFKKEDGWFLKTFNSGLVLAIEYNFENRAILYTSDGREYNVSLIHLFQNAFSLE